MAGWLGGPRLPSYRATQRPSYRATQLPDYRYDTHVTKLKSEIEVPCPCCGATLVVDTNLGRVVSHHEPERGDKPELTEASRILAQQDARREALFEQSVLNEKGRDDALSRRFEEALKQAKGEPVSKPLRDFDLD